MYLKQYTTYLKNVGRSVKITDFDDDWEPVGPKVRRMLVDQGLVIETVGCLRLTDKGLAL